MKDWEKMELLVNMTTLRSGQVVSVMLEHNSWIELRVFDPVNGNSTKRWAMGDAAIFGSYNLIYTGPITKITRNSVTIHGHGKSKRMKLEEFIKKNHDYDPEYIREHNASVSQSI